MKKKMIAALLSFTMAAAMMTGCGKEETPATEPVKESTTQESSEEPSAEPSTNAAEASGGLAEAEALPAEAAYHFNFDGSDQGIATVVQTEDKGTNTGANFGLGESDTYADKDGAQQPIALQYADGPVDKCAYLDGNFGLKLPVEALETENYTISFWMNADRLSTFGPTLQMGSNIGMLDTENKVTWINFTQTEWGTNNAKIFPVVWNRNSETTAWPWVYAADDSIHGKKEWVMVTLVASGSIYKFEEDGLDRNACQLYLNGELAFDAAEGTYGGLATGIMDASDNFECLLGINYWDTIFKGFVDDMYIYKESLTPGQVASLYLLGDPKVESVAGSASGEALAADPSAQVVSVIDDKAIATLGVPTCDNGFWASFSDGYELKDGGNVKLHFNNYGSGINNWENYVVAFTNTRTTADKAPSADNYSGYLEYGVVRSDAFAWGFPEGQDPAFEFSWNWDDFLNIMKDADVTLTISRKGSDIAMNAVILDSAGKEYTYKVDGRTAAADKDPMYVFLTNEKSYIEILSAE